MSLLLKALKQAETAHAEKTAPADSGLALEPAEPDPAKALERKGKVWKQSPGSGGPADQGSTVVLWVNPE